MAEPSMDGSQQEVLISADSHVVELPDLWETRLPSSFRGRAPKVYFDDLGSLSSGDRAKLVRLNVARLYDLKLPMN